MTRRGKIAIETFDAVDEINHGIEEKSNNFVSQKHKKTSNYWNS